MIFDTNEATNEQKNPYRAPIFFISNLVENQMLMDIAEVAFNNAVEIETLKLTGGE